MSCVFIKININIIHILELPYLLFAYNTAQAHFETFEQRIIFLVLSFMTDLLKFHIDLTFSETERKRLSGL